MFFMFLPSPNNVFWQGNCARSGNHGFYHYSQMKNPEIQELWTRLLVYQQDIREEQNKQNTAHRFERNGGVQRPTAANKFSLIFCHGDALRKRVDVQINLFVRIQMVLIKIV